MENQEQDTTRAATYLAAKERMDLRGPKSTRTGKTRNSVNCTAGNKRCGNRCIPNNWDCRLEGKGTNSELASHKTDPLAGIASIQRGSKDLFQGVVRVNPAQVQRGRNSLIRGTVKLAPGNNLEQKKQLKKQLTEASTPIMAVLGVTLVGLAGHAGLKRGFAVYRNGVGADIDRAAATAVDSILDRVPGIAGNRAATRAAGAAAISELGGVVTRGQRIGQTRAATSGNVGRIGPLSFRPNAADTKSSGLVASMNNLRARAKNGNLNYDEYKTQSVQALYGATNQGTRLAGQRGSIYSEHAANEFLVSKFKLNGAGVVGANASESMAIRNGLIDTQLAERLGTWGETMRSDMKLRRMTGPQGEIRSKDVSQYISTVSPRSLGYSFEGMTAPQRNQATAEAKRLMRTAISGQDLGKEAESIRRNLVSDFDRYFDNNAQMMSQPAAATNSPFGDGMTGLARYIRRTTNNPGPVLSRDHADLIIRNDYHVRVMQQRANYSIGDNTARRIAQQITRSPELPDVDSAYRVLNSNGFTQLSRSAPAAGKSPAASRTSRRTPAAAQPQQPRRLLTESELMRNAPPGYSPEAAREWARQQIAERGDSHESGLPPRIAAYLETRQDFKQSQRLGKPCGESNIPKAHECNLDKTKKEPPETRKRSNTGAKVAVAAALVGAAALGGRAAFKNRQNIPMYKGAAKYVDTGIKTMSSTKVRDAISKLPVKFQEPANKLVGKAKVGLAFVAADAQGMKLTKVDPVNNFSTFKNPKTGHIMSVGAVDDTLVTFVSEPRGKAGAFDKYGIAFQTDLSFDQKQGLSKAQGLGVSKQVKSMFSAQLDEMPENAVLFNNPYKDDGLGDKRSAIYKRFKFTELPGVRGGNLWALKNQGKLTKIPPEQADYVAKLIRGDAAEESKLPKEKPTMAHGTD